MFNLITLGAADLLGPDGNRIGSVVHQPKRFALLVYLALPGRGRPVRRDSVLATFWPEKSDQNARHCLKQAALHLRQSLGPAALISEGKDSLRLGTDVLSCDALLFEEAVAAGDYRGSFELYQGDLLPGFFVGGSQEFDSWLEHERSRLRALATEAAVRAAEQQRGRGNAAGVGHWARRLADLAGTDEALIRDAIGLLAEIGDRAGAADVYARFERLLASELDLPPSPETWVFAQRVLAADVQADPALFTGDSPSGTSASDQADHEPTFRPTTRVEPLRQPTTWDGAPFSRNTRARWSAVLHPRRRLLAALLVVVSVTFVTQWNRSERTSAAMPAAQADRYTVLRVLDFTPIGPDEDVVLLAHALPAAARRHLMNARGLVVLSTDEQMPGAAGIFAGYEGPITPEFAFELGGAVHMKDGEITVEVVLRTGARRLIHASSVRYPASRLDAARDSMARQIAWTVRTELGREHRAKATRAETPAPPSAHLIESAEALIEEARELRGRRLAEAAAAGYVRADSLLAAAEAAAQEWSRPSVVRSRTAADHAWLMLGPPFADKKRARLEFERALQHASRAVVRGPDDPSAYEMRGTVAYWMWLTLDLDRTEGAAFFDSAESDLRRAIGMDPARVRAWSLLSDMAYNDGDFAGAYWAAIQGYDLDTYHDNTQELLVRLFASSYEIGDRAGAQGWCAETRQRFGAGTAAAYCALALLAWRESHDPADVEMAWSRVRELESPYRETVTPRLETMVASVLAGAGLRDSAEAVILRARERSPADAELLHLEAHARAVLGQRDSAIALLSSYVAVDPARRRHVAASRRFEGPLHASDPRR